MCKCKVEGGIMNDCGDRLLAIRSRSNYMIGPLAMGRRRIFRQRKQKWAQCLGQPRAHEGHQLLS